MYMKTEKYWDKYCTLTNAAQGGDWIYLCTEFKGYELFELMKPTSHDEVVSDDYWGRADWEEQTGEFNGLRQNLVLLMCALNNEL